MTDYERHHISEALAQWDWKVSLYQADDSPEGQRGRVTILIEGGHGQISMSTLHDIRDVFSDPVEDIVVDWSPQRWSNGAAEITVRFARSERCADCGLPGETTGHMTCMYPKDH